MSALERFVSQAYTYEYFRDFIAQTFAQHSDKILEPRPQAYKEGKIIVSYTQISQPIPLDSAHTLGIYAFETHSHNAQAKITLHKEIASILKNRGESAILACFYEPSSAQFRLSLISQGFDYEANKPTFSNPRRQSFVLGTDAKTKTAKIQLHKLQSSTTLKDLEDAFSLEPVTDAFYDEYNALYERIIRIISSEQDCINALQGYENLNGTKAINAFVKKLLGRIVFLYFLQKKGWLGVEGAWGSGDREFVKTLFTRAQSEGKSFYASYLCPLFFESLNTKRDGDYSPIFKCKIPFLNGGLFGESFRIGSPKDSKYSLDRSVQLIDILDNALFGEIFDFFDEYNFTIEESAPNDVEIAIDPEMLGKIFENLIDYNHDTGTYYTRRAMVYFMCKNALIYSLATKQNSSLGMRCESDLDSVADTESTGGLESHNLDSMVSLESSADSVQSFAHSNISAQSAETESRPLRGAKNRKKGGSSASADLELEAEKRGSPLDCRAEGLRAERSKNSGGFFGAKGSEEGINPFLRKNTLDSEKIETIRENENLKSKQIQNPTHDTSDNIKNALVDLIYHHNIDNPFIRAHAHALRSHLKSLKILDPAIGSGAFPMGLLSEILNLHALLHKAITGEELDTQARAGLKREIIAHQIYGVDIDADAIEIARLRFWLSIAVDEDTPSPLPNLDFKFMQGNSLLECLALNDKEVFHILPKEFTSTEFLDQEQTHSSDKKALFTQAQKQELEHHFLAYYHQTNHSRKQETKTKIFNIMQQAIDTRIKEINAQILNNKRNMILVDNTTPSKHKKRNDKLQAQNHNLEILQDELGKLLQSYRDNDFHTDKLFLYRFFFAPVFESGGFDIVIGNPPYIRQEEIKNKKHILAEFGSFGNASADIYTYFFAKGLEVLKPSGILSFITSNKYERAGYGKNLRAMFLGHTILSHYDFNGVKVFDSASVDTAVLSVQKDTPQETHRLNHLEFVKHIKTIPQEDKVLWDIAQEHQAHIPQDVLSDESFIFPDSKTLALKRKIESIGTPLKDWDISIYRGILTGYNEAFIIDSKKREEILESCDDSKASLKPYPLSSYNVIAGNESLSVIASKAKQSKHTESKKDISGLSPQYDTPHRHSEPLGEESNNKDISATPQYDGEASPKYDKKADSHYEKIDYEKGVIYLNERERTEALIKPILRGRDIKRYSYEWAGLWVINTHNGYESEALSFSEISGRFDVSCSADSVSSLTAKHLHNPKISSKILPPKSAPAKNAKIKIPPIDIEDYPALKAYFDKVANEGKKGKGKGFYDRDDKGQTPYNLRNCAYLEEFAKPKIVYSEIVREPQFYLDNGDFKFGYFYAEATSFILTGKEGFSQSLEYLLGILHSKLATFAFKSFYAGGGLGESGYRYKKAFLEKLPIPKIDSKKEADFVKIVREIIELKNAHSKGLTQAKHSSFCHSEARTDCHSKAKSEEPKNIESSNTESTRDISGVSPQYDTPHRHSEPLGEESNNKDISATPQYDGEASPKYDKETSQKYDKSAHNDKKADSRYDKRLKELESTLDSMVFSLYGLSEQEIQDIYIYICDKPTPHSGDRI